MQSRQVRWAQVPASHQQAAVPTGSQHRPAEGPTQATTSNPLTRTGYRCHGARTSPNAKRETEGVSLSPVTCSSWEPRTWVTREQNQHQNEADHTVPPSRF